MSLESPRRAVTGMVAATLVSRASGFGRAVLLVLLVGGTASAAGGQAFAVAMEIPANVLNLVAGGLLGAVLVPEIVRATEAPGEQARNALDRVLTTALVAALAVTGGLMLLAGPLVRLYAVGWPESWIELGTGMALWCLPQVFLLVVYSVLSQVLNAEHRYAAAFWAPVACNVMAIGGLGLFAALFGPGHDDPGDWTPWMVAVLCGTATLGTAVQAAVLVVALRRSGFRLRPRLGVRGMGRVGGTAGLAFAGIVAGQLAFLVVSNAANLAGARLHSSGVEGAGLNSLNAAYLVVLVPHGVFAVALATASFTAVSRRAGEGDFAAVADEAVRACTRIALATLPLAAVLVVGGETVGRVLWGSTVIGQVLALLALGSASFSQLYAVNRSLLAVRAGSAVLVTQVLVAAVTAAGAITAFFVPPAWAVPTIALAVSLSNVLGWLAGCSLLRRRLRVAGADPGSNWIVRPQLRLLAATVVVTVVGSLVVHSLAFASVPWLTSLLALAAIALLVPAAIAGVALLLDDRELPALLRALRRPAPTIAHDAE